MSSIDKRFLQSVLLYLSIMLIWHAAFPFLVCLVLPRLFVGDGLLTTVLYIAMYVPYLIGCGHILTRMCKVPVSVGILLCFGGTLFILLIGNWIYRDKIEGLSLAFEIVLAYIITFFNLVPLLWKAGSMRRELMTEILTDRIKGLPSPVAPFFLNDEKTISWGNRPILMMPVLFQTHGGWNVHFFVLIGDDAYEWTYFKEQLYISQNTSIDGAIAAHLRKVTPDYWFPETQLNDKHFWDHCVLAIYGTQFAYLKILPEVFYKMN